MPSQLDELTYNELLALVYHKRAQEKTFQVLAWDISRCVGNLLAKKPLGFYKLFPDPVREKIQDRQMKKRSAMVGQKVPFKETTCQENR